MHNDEFNWVGNITPAHQKNAGVILVWMKFLVNFHCMLTTFLLQTHFHYFIC